jgi:hypothetical protein
MTKSALEKVIAKTKKAMQDVQPGSWNFWRLLNYGTN